MHAYKDVQEQEHASGLAINPFFGFHVLKSKKKIDFSRHCFRFSRKLASTSTLNRLLAWEYLGLSPTIFEREHITFELELS